ncbi:MAG: hypothetical protein EOP83_20055 [Verrucomicrobiaceae bacterium]|nr:MAG: hypothetical protein EOP83_20055 [Verrucomicrobiaceae bacterium]
MIEEGEFVRRKPRAAKRISGEKREAYLAANPPGSYRFRVPTGIWKNEVGLPSTDINRILSERQAWCRQQIGADNARWNHRFEKVKQRERELVFLFQEQPHAMAFMLRWGGLK